MKFRSKDLRYQMLLSGMKTGEILRLFNEILYVINPKAHRISKNTIHNWRRGDTTPVPVSMYILAAVLDRRVDEIFTPVIDEELQEKVNLIAKQLKEELSSQITKKK